jgi:hypothetical protein
MQCIQQLQQYLKRQTILLKLLTLLTNIVFIGGSFAFCIVLILSLLEEHIYGRKSHILAILTLVTFAVCAFGTILCGGVLYYLIVQPVLKKLSSTLEQDDFVLLGPIARFLQLAFSFPIALPGIPPAFVAQWKALMLGLQPEHHLVLTKAEKAAMEFLLTKMEVYRGYAGARKQAEGGSTPLLEFREEIAPGLLHVLSLCGDAETLFVFRDYMQRTQEPMLQKLAQESIAQLEQRLGLDTAAGAG